MRQYVTSTFLEQVATLNQKISSFSQNNNGNYYTTGVAKKGLCKATVGLDWLELILTI